MNSWSSFFVISALLFACKVKAQYHDNNWIFGFSENINPRESIHFSFDNDSLHVQYRPKNGGTQFAQAISDKKGKLLFYSNSCHIFNADNEIMPNGDSINYNWIWSDMLYAGYPLGEGFQALPMPGNDSLYGYFTYSSGVLPCQDLRYNLVDPYANGGQGQVLVKDSILLQRLFFDNMAVVKHGNGRDWWMICPNIESNLYYKILISASKGIEIDSQEIGSTWYRKGGIGTTLFNPSGDKYFRVSAPSRLGIMNFDRCTGMFSDYVDYKFSNITAPLLSGASISPNGKYLYITHTDTVYQFNLEAPDLLASRHVVGVYDGFKDYDLFFVNYFRATLAADGKIYIASTNGNHYLHVIDKPNEYDCELKIRKIRLDGIVAVFLPSYPNFRLHDLADSPCDTLGINRPIEPGSVECLSLSIYPNPVFDRLRVNMDRALLAPLSFRIINSLGQSVFADNWKPGDQPYEINVEHLPPGSYFLMPEAKYCLQPIPFIKAQ